MAATPSIDPQPVVTSVQFQGGNWAEVLDFLLVNAPDNQPVRGGVRLQPATPGDPLTMTVELADGTLVELTQGDAAVVSSLDGVASVSTVLAANLEKPK